MKLFVGTNSGHGAALAALNEEGDLVFAADEGRLTGKRECDRFPATALRALVNDFPHDSLVWAEGWDRWKRFLNKGLYTTLKYGLFDSSYFRSRLVKETDRLYHRSCPDSQSRGKLGMPRFTGHHLAHAFSLLPWGLSPKSVILVSDTTSESASISIYYWCGTTMRLLHEVPYPHSPGAAYHQMAHHLGFPGSTGPGKLMALAGYGQPRWVGELRSICKIDDRGFRFDLHRYPAWHRTDAWTRFARGAASPSLRHAILGNLGRGEEACDLARSVQDWFTLTTLDLVDYAVRLARDDFALEVTHIGLAGGAALNCQTNGSIVRSCCKRLGIGATVSPWSDDPGTAIGAAVWLFHRLTGQPPRRTLDPFLGPRVACANQLQSIGEHAVLAAARKIESGGIVALVSGRLEFGPRALGHRCLLGDPRRTKVRDRLNIIKGRPWFMPFAPVVLESDFSSYFVGDGSTNMAWTVEPTAQGLEDIPAAIHANGQARVQVLPDGGTTLLSRLLKSFRTLTSTGALLLTSLNGENQAIAADIDVAREMVRRMGIDGTICDGGWYPGNV